jgi:hypothetical protein
MSRYIKHVALEAAMRSQHVTPTRETTKRKGAA